MSNKKNMPAASKAVAGKNNKKTNKSKNAASQIRQNQKNAQRVLEEKERKLREREKRSKKIRRQRQKVQEKESRLDAKKQKRSLAKNEQKKRKQNIVKKLKYYTSKNFLASFNYFRIFSCIVLPMAVIVFCCISISQSVAVNVPSEIRSAEFSGRIESDVTAHEITFNVQQQQAFADLLNSHGSGKFEFYFNSVIEIDDDFSTDELYFGNPKSNDVVLIAVIYDNDGKILYRSLGLEPNREISEAAFFDELSYGMHDVKVAVNAYDRNTYKKIGTKYAKIKLAVGVKYNGE